MTKELLDINESPDLLISANFLLEEMKMKKDMQWRIKLSVKKILPKSYHYLDIDFLVDEEPYNRRMERIEERMREVGNKPQLFDSEQKKDMKTLDGQMADVRNELRKLKDECETINTTASIEELKYKDGNTVLTLLVPSDTVIRLNENKLNLGHYRVNIQPNYKA